MSFSIWYYLILLLVLLPIYFIPTLVARKRQHPSRNSILIINIFLGWTFLGWVGALAWSFSGAKQK